MILAFPDLDTVRLALTSGVLPPDVALAPAAASWDAAGRVFVETEFKLPRKAADELKKLGVVTEKRHPADPQPVSCWPQILPLAADPHPPQLASSAPVLFELPADAMPGLVAEMLRLGNDRQGFRFVAGPDGTSVLLRVIGPPYYTLLRALDAGPGGQTVRAYTERAPRVWVELGQAHPLADRVQVPDGELALLRAPRDWRFLPDAPFTDVYELLRFPLPHQPTAYTEAPAAAGVTVPLRLAAGNAADVAELWVVRGDGVARLDALVRDADDRLTEQLTFAVTAPAADGEQTVVLRTRPSKKAPPVLELDGAVGFKPYWRLPNLFVPVGRRLHPTLRRDAVSKLLADDKDRVVWLFPGENGAFTPESLPEDSFRPLRDWVEYIVDTNRGDLEAWVQSATFDFDSFVCADTAPPKPKDPGTKPGREKPEPKADALPPKPAAKPAKAAEVSPAAVVGPAPVVKPPSEWKKRCDDLERQFAAVEGPLDAPERLALWPQLAEANAGVGDERRNEAAVCWANALWTKPDVEWVAGWYRSELPAGKLPVTAAEFDARLKPNPPTPGEMRAFAASFLAAAEQSPPPAWLPARLPAVQRHLEAFDEKLPIRGAWLAAVRLARLSGSDVLGLARTRDRLLNRLLERGLNPELDLPGFLRYAGLKDSARVRAVREGAADVYKAARAWAARSLKPAGPALGQNDSTATVAYLDLMFAFGFARLGEANTARQLADAAREVLVQPLPPEPKGKDTNTAFVRAVTGRLLFDMFAYRVEQAALGKPHAGQLSSELLEAAEAVKRKVGGAGQQTNPFGLADYVVTRMRVESTRILEPQEKFDAYADWIKQTDEVKKELTELAREKDAARLGRRLRELLKDGGKTKGAAEARLTVLLDGLPLAARVGPELTVEMVALVPGVLKAVAAGTGTPPTADQPKKQGQLLERALFLAAHFDRTELVRALVDQFIEYVRGRPEEQRYELVNVVAGQSLKSLRKVGLRDEIDRLLRRLQDDILKGKSFAQLKAQYAAKPDLWSDALQTLLNLAAGWLTFGLTEQAAGILDAARGEILGGGGKMSDMRFVNLCGAYLAAVGQGPADAGMARILELFEKLDPARVPVKFTTGPYYSRFHLRLVEDAVSAFVSDDFAMGQGGRRWLDEDEHLVRRRIHADTRELVAKSGL